jgi:hypothetical protein
MALPGNNSGSGGLSAPPSRTSSFVLAHPGGGGGGGGSEDTEISAFFPSFLWVLRDFTLDMVDDDGNALAPRDYLESCLAPQEGFSSDAQSRNRIRRVLTSYFRERDCFTLVRPLEDESQLQRVDALPESALRSEFRLQLQHLRARILGSAADSGGLLRPKTMHGQCVTGRMLGGLAQAYVDSINHKAVPTLGSAWGDVTRVECEEAQAAAFTLYSAALTKDYPTGALPVDTDDLHFAHEKARILTISAYDKRAVGPLADQYRRDLKDRVDREWALWQQSNAAASEAACSRLISRLWAQLIEPRLLGARQASDAAPAATGVASQAKKGSAAGGVGAGASDGAGAVDSGGVYSSYETFAQDLDAVRTQYFAQAKGPSVHKALGTFLLGAVASVVRAVNAARASESDRRLVALQQRLLAMQGAIDLATARAAGFEKAYGDISTQQQVTAVEKAKLEQQTRIAQEERAKVQAKLAEAEATAEALKDKLKEERLAHADTRIKLKALGAGGVVSPTASGIGGAGTGGGMASVAEALMRANAAGKASRSHSRGSGGRAGISSSADSDESGSGLGGAASPSSSRGGRGAASVDLDAILGGDPSRVTTRNGRKAALSDVMVAIDGARSPGASKPLSLQPVRRRQAGGGNSGGNGRALQPHERPGEDLEFPDPVSRDRCCTVQ